MALTRITKGVIKPNENYDTHDINSTGIITATGANISGNLTVGGVLTYEDVSSIDSVGIITANQGIHVGAGVSAVGVGTFSGLDISGDIDVDGHTNLDNVSVAGISTFSDHVSIPDDKELRIGNSADLKLVHTTSLSSISSGGVNNFTIRQSAGSGFLFIHGDQLHLRSQSTNEPYLIATNNGPVSLYYDQNNHNTAKLVTTATGVTIDGTAVAGGLDISGDIDVDGHTNLDNLSVAGVSTFSDDVTFTTANGNNIVFDKSANDLTFGDNVPLYFGANNDLAIYHDTSVSRILDSYGHLLVNSNLIQLKNQANSKLYFSAVNGSHTKLFYDGVEKFTTASSGINVSGTTTTTGLAVTGVSTFTGNIDANGDLDVDGHTNLDNVSIAGINTIGSQNNTVYSPHTSSWAVRSAITLLGNYGGGLAFNDNNNNGFVHYVDTSGQNFYIKNAAVGATPKTSIKCVKDGAVELHHNNTKRLETSSVGVSIPQDLDVDGHTNLDNVNIVGVTSTTDEIKITTDNKSIVFGASSDLSMKHDGTNSYILNNTGTFYISADHLQFNNRANNEAKARFVNNGAAELYHNGTLRFETSATGVSLSNHSYTLITGAMGSTENIKITNTTSGGFIQIGMQQQDSDGLHHRAIIKASKGSANIAGKLELLARGSGGGTNRGWILDAAVGIQANQQVLPETDSTYDLGSNTKRWSNLYADTLYGDGSNLTGISAGTSLSGSTNNTVCTVTGANAIQGESNLTFDGSKLNITTGGAGFRITRNSQYIELDGNFGNGGDQSLATSAGFRIQTGGVGNSYERIRITSAGDVGIGYNSPTVKLHVREAASGASSYDNRHHIIVEDDSEGYLGFYLPTNGYAGIRFYDTSGQEGLIDYYYGNDEMHFHSSGTHIFKNAGTETFRIENGGAVKMSTNNAKIRMGSGHPFELYHNGTYSYISDNRSGGSDELRIAGRAVRILNQDSSSTTGYFSYTAAKLYYTNYEKLSTVDYGVNFSGTGAIKVPVGTTAQRPTGSQGMLRVNTSTEFLEMYGSSGWVNVASTVDLGTASNPAVSGKELYNAGKGSGNYYIKPNGYSGTAIECYVDNTTHGGGWVLVASYTPHSGFEQSSNTGGLNENTVKAYATSKPPNGNTRLLNKNFINYLAHQNTTNGSNSDYSIMGVHGRSGTGYVHWEVKANTSNRNSSFDFFTIMYRTQDANNNMDFKIRQETSTSSTTDYVGKSISGSYSNYNGGRGGTADGNGSYHYLIDDHYGGYEWAFRENVDDIPSSFGLSVMFIR